MSSLKYLILHNIFRIEKISPPFSYDCYEFSNRIIYDDITRYISQMTRLATFRMWLTWHTKATHKDSITAFTQHFL